MPSVLYMAYFDLSAPADDTGTTNPIGYTISNGTDSFDVSWQDIANNSDGNYLTSHGDFTNSPALGDANEDKRFGQLFEDALEAKKSSATPSPITATFSVTWEDDDTLSTYGYYTVSVDSGTFSISYDSASLSSRTLGSLISAGSQTASKTSQTLPWWSVLSTVGGRSSYSYPYEPRQMSNMAVADDGSSYAAIARSSGPSYIDWMQMFEPLANTFAAHKSAVGLWTFEELIKHARCVYPIAVRDTGIEDGVRLEVVALRPDASHWDPQQNTVDYTGHWHVPFRTLLVGEGTD